MAVWKVPTLLTTVPSRQITSAAVVNRSIPSRSITKAGMLSVTTVVSKPMSWQTEAVSRAPWK